METDTIAFGMAFLFWVGTLITAPRVVFQKGHGHWQAFITIVMAFFCGPIALLHVIALEDLRMKALEESVEAHHRWAASQLNPHKRSSS